MFKLFTRNSTKKPFLQSERISALRDNLTSRLACFHYGRSLSGKEILSNIGTINYFTTFVTEDKNSDNRDWETTQTKLLEHLLVVVSEHPTTTATQIIEAAKRHLKNNDISFNDPHNKYTLEDGIKALDAGAKELTEAAATTPQDDDVNVESSRVADFRP